MKFIKDIIGERRERVQQDGFAPDAASAQPVAPPEPDAMAAFFADTSEAAEAPAPLRLDDEFRTAGVQQDGPAAAGAAEDRTEAAAAPEEAPVQAESVAAAPDEQAIAAFFAREQAAAADPVEAFFAEDAEGPDALQDDDLEDGDEETPFALGGEADFSRLMQPEAPEDGGAERKPYRVFTRRLKPDAEPRVEAAPEAAADPVPEQMPEQAHEDAAVPELEQIVSAAAVQAMPEEPPAAPEPPAAAAPEPIDVPAPSMGRGAARAGRVKTRLLGFSPDQGAGSDPFARSAEAGAPGYTEFPVGWLAVVKGPGRGAAFTLFSGVTVIGRGADQTVRLDFGDNSISRDNHAAIAYDAEQKAFYIGHGGKANLVRCNGRPVLSTEELSAGDEIRIGETTLRFVPLCGADFGWDQMQQGDAGYAAVR